MRSLKESSIKKNFLIAILKSPSDFLIAKEKHWYRIPCNTKLVPKIVKDGTIEYIAFYFTNSFNELSKLIIYYAKVTNVSIVRRIDLFPELTSDPRKFQQYYKIEISTLKKIKEPIVSPSQRRILFISTSKEHFENAKEINDLYFESPIEEKFWKFLKKDKIQAERQYYVKYDNHNFILDFAIFCQNGKVNIECDGDTYHLKELDVKNDKKRDNILSSNGWSVLRYTTDDIIDENNFSNTIQNVYETINHYGGFFSKTDKIFKKIDNSNQLNLFDS